MRIDAAQLDALEEDAFFLLGGKDEDRVRVTRCGQLSVPAFEVATRPGAMAALQALMLKGGARALSEEMWHTLRIEAGRPVYGIDMGENTIPIEAGIGDRAIDHTKGCYTGQEVIVRIRDRGKVNRHLCGFTWDEGAGPRPGAELFGEVGEKPLGWITSAAFSPRFGGIALGYVRREVDPPAKLYLESSAGPALEVRSLDDEGWGTRTP